MRVAAGIEELIGNTPLVELRRIGEKMGLKACLLAKLESKNPAGSAKDRVALEMIEKAVGCPIKYISVGAGREEYIER